MKNIIVVFLLVMFTSCGSKGDLALEPESLPLKIADLTISQIGLDIHLKFSLPELLSDNKTLDKSNLSKVYIYHSNFNIPEEKFRKKGSLLLRIKEPAKSILTEAGKSNIKIPFRVKDLDNIEHFFGIVYYIKKKRSPISLIRSLKTVTPYRTINKIEIEQERKIILLKWKKPEYDVSKNKVSQIAGFNLYRKIVKEQIKDPNGMEPDLEEQEPVFKKINTGFIIDEYYEDNDVSTDGKYFYQVSTAYNKKIESFPSKIISITLKDIYPPDVPENLFVFKGGDFMLLNWEKVKDKDLSHYAIYRRIEKRGRFKRIADNLVKTRYKDNKVKRGVIYFYYVVAVDKKANESEPSILVNERY